MTIVRCLKKTDLTLLVPGAGRENYVRFECYYWCLLEDSFCWLFKRLARDAMRSTGYCCCVLSLLFLAEVGAKDEEAAARQRKLYFKKWRRNPKASGKNDNIDRSSQHLEGRLNNCKLPKKKKRTIRFFNLYCW